MLRSALPGISYLVTHYILAIDQGTTGTSTLIMDHQLNRVAEASLDFKQYFPQPGWVEHDLNEVWASVLNSIKQVASRVNPTQIAAIGITNQRETLCFWDRKTLAPLGRAIVWAGPPISGSLRKTP